jgi:6-phosphofructokinase 1
MGKVKTEIRVGILSAGGDCPGINAAIRGVGKTAIIEYGMKVIGISSGFSGLIEKDYMELTEDNLSGILTMGGTVLGTSREKPFKNKHLFKKDIDKPKIIKKNYDDLGLDCLVCIGGNGTMTTAALLANEGLNVIGIPKTIDNDIWGTDQTFGFDSAVSIATEAIDRLHTTANSHKRIMVIELMGNTAGWLTLYAGIAGGGDIILIPEIEYQEEAIIKCLKRRVSRKKPYSIVVVAEGIRKPAKKSAAHHLSQLIQDNTGFETRETILGYNQRGGTPSAIDRILATRLGSFAASMIAEKKYGGMVSLLNNEMAFIPLTEVMNKKKMVPVNHPLIIKGRRIGTSFGDL